MARRCALILLLFAFARIPIWAADNSPSDTGDSEESTEQEMEARDIIPRGGITVSTAPITPIAPLALKNPHDQGLEELAAAQELWLKGHSEAASDVALTAYDDLISVHLPRRNKKKRQKLRAERHEAATVYIDSSIAYIQRYVRRAGNTSEALAEGRARLGDLRDVSKEYLELNKKVSKALEAYLPPEPPVVAASSTTAVSTGTAISSTTAPATGVSSPTAH